MSKPKPTNRVVNFKCELDCGGKCCQGITLALPAEVKNVYDKVPLTLVMHAIDVDSLMLDPRLRKEAPRCMPKLTMMEDDGTYIGELCVFFDFAMGAWHSEKSCYLLKDGLCSIHNDNKPLKCKLLPIQPLSSELAMHQAYECMRSYCPGVKNMTAKDCCVYKNGKLCNKTDIKNLQEYYDLAASTLDFSRNYAIVLSHLSDGELMKQLRNAYEEAMDNEEHVGLITSYEVPFFPADEFMKELGVSREDYVEKQLAVMEKFKEYDLEGFEKSFVKEQYNILKNGRELDKNEHI